MDQPLQDQTPIIPVQSLTDKIKIYLIEVGMRKAAPAALAAALSALAGLFAAHKEILEQWGVTYGTWPLSWVTPPTGPVIVIELDTVNTALWAVIAAIVTGLVVTGTHHINAAITGKPQSGGQRVTDV